MKKYEYVGGGYFREKSVPQGEKAEIVHAPVYVKKLQDRNKVLEELLNLKNKIKE